MLFISFVHGILFAAWLFEADYNIHVSAAKTKVTIRNNTPCLKKYR